MGLGSRGEILERGVPAGVSRRPGGGFRDGLYAATDMLLLVATAGVDVLGVGKTVTLAVRRLRGAWLVHAGAPVA